MSTNWIVDYVVVEVCSYFGVDYDRYNNSSRKTGELLRAQVGVVHVLLSQGFSKVRIAEYLGLSRNRVQEISLLDAGLEPNDLILKQRSVGSEILALRKEVALLRTEVSDLKILEEGNAVAVSQLMQKSN